MKIGEPDWPVLDEPVSVEYDGWYAVWTGGEYIEVYPSDPGPQLDAGVDAVHVISTVGDEFDPEDPDDYVRSELRSWVREDSGAYIANGWC